MAKDNSSGIYFVRQKPKTLKSKKQLAQALAMPVSLKGRRGRPAKIMVGDEPKPSGKMGVVRPSDTVATIQRAKKTYAPLRPLDVGPEGLPTVDAIMANPQLLENAPESVQAELRKKIADRLQEHADVRQAQLAIPAALERGRSEALQQSIALQKSGEAPIGLRPFLNLFVDVYEPTRAELGDVSIPMLHKYAKALGLKGYSGMTRNRLEDFLIAKTTPVHGLGLKAGALNSRGGGMMDMLKGLAGVKTQSENDKLADALKLIAKHTKGGNFVDFMHGIGHHLLGGQFQLPTGTNPTGTPTGGALLGANGKGRLHVNQVMSGIRLPEHFKNYMTLANKVQTGGSLSGSNMQKLDDYRTLHGGGLFDGLFSRLKSSASSLSKVLLPAMLEPVLGSAAPLAAALVPKLFAGGALLGANGKGRLHVNQVMAGIRLPEHFKNYMTLANKVQTGGSLSGSNIQKLHDYRTLHGGGFFDSLWSGIKAVGKTVLPAALPFLTPLLAPVLGPAAPIVTALLPKLLGGSLKGRRPKHVSEVMAGLNLKKHFKKFMHLARKSRDGGSLTPRDEKKLGDYVKLNGGGFFDSVWSGIKSLGSKVVENLPAIIENAPKAIEYGKKAYDFGKSSGIFGKEKKK